MDNFYKSLIIYQKIKCGIPIILMGETGCGKTSLLNMLAIFMYKGTTKMKILKCHSGTKDKDIIDFINNITDNIEKEEDEELKEIMEKYKKNELSVHYDPNEHYKIHYQKIKERKIWVFFDEFNTCNSMQLITEIFCNKTMYGKPIYSSDKLRFLGSVNPYRAMTDKMK